MRAVIGTVISSKPVTLEGAAATVSNFAAAATGFRPELAVFSARASRAFAELLAFHRNLLSPYTSAAGGLHRTGNPADATQTSAGIGVGYESPSLGTNRAAGLENGTGSVVERGIDVKRKKKKMKERAEAAVENVSDERDRKRKKRKERVEVAEGNRGREVELAVRRGELEEMNAGVADSVSPGIDDERDGKRKKRRHEELEEMNAGVADSVAPGIDNERDGKRKKRKERAEVAEGNWSREVELAVRHKELKQMSAGVDDNVAPGIGNERGGKRKKRKERSRDAELAMNDTNRLSSPPVDNPPPLRGSQSIKDP